MNRLTVAQAAARLRRNPELVRRWLRDGRLRGEQIGREWLIAPADLARFTSRQPGRRRRI